MSTLTKTEEQLNHLLWDSSADYGNLDYTLQQADQETVGQFRLRDLFLLKTTQSRLPEMEDAEAVPSLMRHAAHMNTWEGYTACIDMIAAKFQSAADHVNDIRRGVEQRFRARWESRFGIHPISEQEFAPGADIPDQRPLPAYKSADGLFF